MNSTISIERYHDISMGHRVCGHESKCAHLHGHNYRFTFHVMPVNGLDGIGRVIDFSVIKERLCEWLENNWDHRFLIWRDDPMAHQLKELDPAGVVIVGFNPTAENIADAFLQTIAPMLLKDTGVYLFSVKIDETRKCSAIANL